jgi:hypothetical protein
VLSLQQAGGRQLSGRVTDEWNHPLAFATIFLKGTTHGTTSNADGFYRLTAGAEPCTLVFKYLGYKTLEIAIGAGTNDTVINAILSRESYLLSEVVIQAGEDPAYPIMRQALAKRKYYLDQVKGYSCQVYVKGLQRLLQWPEKIFGQPVLVSAFIDTSTKIIYLSESVSELHYQHPDQYFEEMVSSKVSGSSRGFSWNRARDMQFSLYEPLIKTDVAPRGLISPLAPSAFFYYRFRHEGSFTENHLLVHKIAVIPRRKNDPIFSGHIYIQEGTWRLHGADLTVTSQAGLRFIDTLSVSQVFIPVNDTLWMPAMSSFYFHYSLMGFIGNGHFTGVFSDYRIHPLFPSGFFSSKTMKVREESNQRDSIYWESIRPVPLTEIERRDYHFKDSLQNVRHSKAFLDSVDRATNRPSLTKFLLTGYQYRKRYRKLTYSFSPLVQNLQFNTVEGFNIGLSTTLTKITDTLFWTRAEINPFIQYNVSSRNLYASLCLSRLYDRKKSASLSLEAGRKSFQFDAENPIHVFVNTSYTLFDRKNYMKLYLSDYVRLAYTSELINGITAEIVGLYSRRRSLFNTTNYSFVKRQSTYTSNNPFFPAEERPVFPDHHLLHSDLRFIIKPGQEYIDRPYSKIILRQRYPVFILGISWAAGFRTDAPDFVRISLGIQHEFELGLPGALAFDMLAGDFFRGKTIYLPDYHHFHGNLTFFSVFALRHFRLLDYYRFSTADRFAEFHAEYRLKGFLLNKIPGVRRLKLDEHVGFHWLRTASGYHYEWTAGLSKLGIARIEWVAAFEKNQPVRHGFRLALVGLE